MKTAIAGIAIFLLTGRAHLEAGHTGIGAVVGYRTDDRQAWAAMGAVAEGIAIAAVVAVHDFMQACRTGGGIRCNCRLYAAGLAGQDSKILRHAADTRFQPHTLDAVDACQGWRCVVQPLDQFGYFLVLAPGVDHHPGASFHTAPTICRCCARCQTAGRNPTPCTIPLTLIA